MRGRSKQEADVRLDKNMTRIAAPSKGRLQEPSETLLKAAGVKYRKRERALFAHVDSLNAVILFVRPDDIPLLVAEGAADMGMVGRDLIHENECENRVSTRLELGYGHCRLALATRANGGAKTVAELAGLKVAASMANSAREFFKKKSVNVNLLEVSGSVEIMVALGLADAIVDLVESGDTLRDNGLEVIETVSQTQAVLIQSKQPRDPKLCDLIVRRFQGVLTAQQYSLLEYNVPRQKLKDAEKITPGFKSPTVSDLEDPDWVAVKVMVPKKQSIEIMDKLESLGASAILETPITNCRL
jgi:ATP phosphoribosyltransferase